MKPIVTPKHASKKTAEYIVAFNSSLETQSTLQQQEATLRIQVEKTKEAVLASPSPENLEAYSSAKNHWDVLKSAMPSVVTIDQGKEERRALEVAESKLREVEARYDSEKLESEKDEVVALRGRAKPETIRAIDEARDAVQAARNAIPKATGSEQSAFLVAHLEKKAGFWESVKSDFDALAGRFEKAIHEARKALATAVTDRIIIGEDFTVHDYTTPTGAKAAKALEVVKRLEAKQRFIHDSQTAVTRKIKGATHGDTLGILSFLNQSPEEVVKQIEARK